MRDYAELENLTPEIRRSRPSFSQMAIAVLVVEAIGSVILLIIFRGTPISG